MRARCALARRKASELLQRCDVLRAPVPVESLARSLNAIVRYEPFQGDLSGMIHRTSSGETIIGVNSLHSITRQRFTIGHELGHLVLHASNLHVDEASLIGLRDHSSGLAQDPHEVEANQFAAELLMPENLLRIELKTLPPSLDPEEHSSFLAKRFRVSPQAMAIRLSRLDLVYVG